MFWHDKVLEQTEQEYCASVLFYELLLRKIEGKL